MPRSQVPITFTIYEGKPEGVSLGKVIDDNAALGNRAFNMRTRKASHVSLIVNHDMIDTCFSQAAQFQLPNPSITLANTIQHANRMPKDALQALPSRFDTWNI